MFLVPQSSQNVFFCFAPAVILDYKLGIVQNRFGKNFYSMHQVFTDWQNILEEKCVGKKI